MEDERQFADSSSAFLLIVSASRVSHHFVHIIHAVSSEFLTSRTIVWVSLLLVDIRVGIYPMLFK